MQRRSSGLILALLLGSASAAQAEELPPPLAMPEAQTTAAPAAEPSFNSDVERSLAQLTELQCSMLSLFLLTPKPCATP
ncbi:MAG: hypothetical protein VKL97_03240 [Cyanobacteriota bacterium]|nr:hypothetical protein [Cyanobacteriota bacterium]